jgi:hypothetical protein
MLRRKPVKCIQDTEKLARYLIEPRDKTHIKLNERLEAKVSTVINQLTTLLDQYTIFNKDNEETINQSIAQVKYLCYR